MGRLSWRASVWFTVAITDLEVAMAVAVPLRSDFEAAQLRALAKRARDPDQTRRLLARAAIYDGASRTEAAQIGCVIRFPVDQTGVAGLGHQWKFVPGLS